MQRPSLTPTLPLVLLALSLAGCGSSSGPSESASTVAAASSASSSPSAAPAAPPPPAPAAAIRAVAIHPDLWRVDRYTAPRALHVLFRLDGQLSNARLESDRGGGFQDEGIAARDRGGWSEFVLGAEPYPDRLRVVADAGTQRVLSNVIEVPAGGLVTQTTHTLLAPSGDYGDPAFLGAAGGDDTLTWSDAGAPASYLVIVGGYQELFRSGLAVDGQLSPQWIVEVDGQQRSWSPGAASRAVFLAQRSASIGGGVKAAAVYALDASGWAVRGDNDSSGVGPSGPLPPSSPGTRGAAPAYKFRLR